MFIKPNQSSFFFAGTVATTIGYGQMVPTTILSKVTCIAFMCIGVPYFAWMTTLLSQWINVSLRTVTQQKLGFRFSSFQLLYIFGGFVVLILLPTFIFTKIEGVHV